jgi:hypothetical protein
MTEFKVPGEGERRLGDVAKVLVSVATRSGWATGHRPKPTSHRGASSMTSIRRSGSRGRQGAVGAVISRWRTAPPASNGAGKAAAAPPYAGQAGTQGRAKPGGKPRPGSASMPSRQVSRWPGAAAAPRRRQRTSCGRRLYGGARLARRWRDINAVADRPVGRISQKTSRLAILEQRRRTSRWRRGHASLAADARLREVGRGAA